jgi:hypothetical protein
VGLSAVNHAVDAAVAMSPVVRRIARGTRKATGAIAAGAGHAALTAGQAALGATQAVAVGAGQALVDYGPSAASAIGHGAHAVASAAGQALADYGPPVASAIGQGLAQGAHAVASGAVHTALQAPAFASATAKKAYFLGKHMGMSFDELLHLVEQAPRAPMLENPRKRSASPAGLMLGDAAAPETAAPRTTPAHNTELLHFSTEGEWAAMPLGTLVDQLYKRPGFAEALGIKHNKQNVAKILKRHSRAQLAQLILKLDAKG